MSFTCCNCFVKPKSYAKYPYVQAVNLSYIHIQHQKAHIWSIPQKQENLFHLFIANCLNKCFIPLILGQSSLVFFLCLGIVWSSSVQRFGSALFLYTSRVFLCYSMWKNDLLHSRLSLYVIQIDYFVWTNFVPQWMIQFGVTIQMDGIHKSETDR